MSQNEHYEGNGPRPAGGNPVSTFETEGARCYPR
jgi:hypothetical protein